MHGPPNIKSWKLIQFSLQCFHLSSSPRHLHMGSAILFFKRFLFIINGRDSWGHHVGAFKYFPSSYYSKNHYLHHILALGGISK
jgi:hypothetical protein